MKADREPWFAVRRAPAKISAMPIAPQGWAALVAFVVGTIFVGMASLSLIRSWHPVAVVAVLLPTLTAAILGFMRWVVIPHGRDVDAA